MRSAGIGGGEVLVGIGGGEVLLEIGGGEVLLRIGDGVVFCAVLEQPEMRKTINAERNILFI